MYNLCEKQAYSYLRFMKVDNILLDKLTAQAKESPRLRSIMMMLGCWLNLLCWEIATSLTLLAMTCHLKGIQKTAANRQPYNFAPGLRSGCLP